MILKFITRNFYPLILLLILAFIALANYTPGTFLTGWDTLHPEFDFGLNFQRLIYGVWREEQGLGAIAGHSHIADLPRVFILWLSDFILPLNILRYFYVFACLFLGVLGVYYLITHIFQNKKNSVIIGFLTACFYLFSLSTVQQFYVPFEMFPVQYGFLPWLLLWSLKFLQNGRKRDLILYAIFTLLAAPQAYAAQLWYAFFVTYSLFLTTYYFLFDRSKNTLKKILLLVILTVVVNSFWLLPNLYYLSGSSNIPIEAKQNRIFSQEYALRNRETGYLKDVALVKGFYLNWTVTDLEKEKPVYLMEQWREHLKNPFVLFVGYALFAAVIGGIILAFKRKNKLFMSFLPFFAVPFIILINHTPPFNLFYDFLAKFKLFEESLRFVFSKFSILLAFSFTLYFSFFVYFILSYFKKFKLSLTMFIFAILVFYSLPMFSGELISKKMRVVIPKQYFDFWRYMDTQDEAVALELPMYNFAGWQYYDWGYQGAGFLWFGLKQPLLDRDFDRWSVANEQSYREISSALYSRNKNQFEKTLDKFNVQYLVLDKSITTADIKNKRQKVFERETEDILKNLLAENKISLAAIFDNIYVYRISQTRSFSEVKTIDNFIYPYYRWSNIDSVYLNRGDYLIADSGRSTYYPIRDLIGVDEKIKSLDPKSNLIFSKFPLEKSAFGALEIYKGNSNRKNVEFLVDSNGESFIKLQTVNEQTGVYLEFKDLAHKKGYILGIKANNLTGLPLRFCLNNLYTNLCSVYDELSQNKGVNTDYFLVYPSDSGLGYGLSIDNLSFGNYESINEIYEVQFIPFPYDFVSQISRRASGQNDSQKVIILNQTFHKGWLAYIGKDRLDNHVIINNWANGWILPDNYQDEEIIFIFWPQYLQFVGFGLLVLSFSSIIVLYGKKRFKSSSN